MSLLGKVLLGLCVAVALAFFVVAALDYDRRHAWAYSLMRHELAIQGLPVDEQDNPEVYRALGDKGVLDSVFAPVGGNAVPTQLAELDRVQKNINDLIQTQPDEAAKRAILSRIWLATTWTTDERDAVRKKIADPANTIEQLLSEGEGNFGNVFAQARAAKDKRQAIGRLIYIISHLAQPHIPTALQRAQVVMGLKAYVTGSQFHAALFRDLGRVSRYAINEDRATFESAYQLHMVDDKAQAVIATELEHDLKHRNDEKDNWRTQINQRKALAAELRAQIAQATKDAAAAEKEQSAREKEMFDAQRQLALGQDKTRQLESELREKELQR